MDAREKLLPAAFHTHLDWGSYMTGPGIKPATQTYALWPGIKLSTFKLGDSAPTKWATLARAKINHLKVNNSVAFSILTMLYRQYLYVVLKYFYHPKGKRHIHWVVTFSLFPGNC